MPEVSFVRDIQKPRVFLVRSTPERMRLVCLCAGMAILQSAFSDGFASLILAAAAAAGAVGTEYIILYKKGRREDILDCSALATALVLTLFLPNSLHPVYAFLGAIFAIAVVKQSFGGLGSNWFNPVVGGWLFVRLSWPGAFSNVLEGVSALPAAGTASAFDGLIRSFLNSTVFSFNKAPLHGGYIDLFALPYPGMIADRGLLALLVGTIILNAAMVCRFWIPVVYLGVYGVLARLFGAMPFGGAFGKGDILSALLSGTTIAAAFLLASDPVTGAKSGRGAFAVSMTGGVLAFLFRYPAGETGGVVFAAACVNVLVPLLRRIESVVLYTPRARYTGEEVNK